MEPDGGLRHCESPPLSLTPAEADGPGASGWFDRSLERAYASVCLARELMAMPRAVRLQTARQDPRFRRAELLTLFNLEAESAVLAPRGADAGEQEAELATILAARVVRDARGNVRRAGALAHWLLGKALLHHGDPAAAAAALGGIHGYLEVPHKPSAELGLAHAGWAQVAQAYGGWTEAVTYFQRAAKDFAAAGACLPAAACLAETGLLQMELGDLAAARGNLKRAWVLLQDQAAATVTAVRVALACAECDARQRGEMGPDAEPWLERARQLYALPAPSCEDVARTWAEGRIAAAAGRVAEAEAQLGAVHARLLSEGSLAEAVTVSCDLLTARVEGGVALQGEALAAGLEQAFANAGVPWAQALRDLVALEARGHPAYYEAVNTLIDRLGAHQPVPGRPDLLCPQRALTDRLLRYHGELEPVCGAAPETLE
jgi:tetratricopeptide (TPR) repeat protein